MVRNTSTAKPKPTDYDPRPDLAEDHREWVAVLAIAWHRDRDLHGLLHGLRCGGARLETRRARDGREYFKLDYSALLEVWSEDELRDKWLVPHKDAIRELFHRAPGRMNTVLAIVERKAG